MNAFNTQVLNRMAELAAIADGIDRTGFATWCTQVYNMLSRDNPDWPIEEEWKLRENAYQIASVLRGHASPDEKRECLLDIEVEKSICKRLKRNRLARERYAAKKAGQAAARVAGHSVACPGCAYC
jgi:hypothetical protein